MTDDNVPMDTWQRLRAARKAAKVTQQKIADACGVSREAVSQWESPDPAKRSQASLDRLRVYARVCGVSLESLLGVNPATASQFVTLDPTILTAAFRFLRNVIEGQGMPFEADSDPESVALAYEWFAAQPDAQHPTNVIQLGRKLAELKKAREVRRESGRDSETGDRAK